VEIPLPREPEKVTPALLRGMPLPAPGASKRDRGDVLVVGGARKTPGAAQLAGIAALRVGAGRLTIAIGESAAPSLAVAVPEAGVIGLPETDGGSIPGSAASALEETAASTDALLIGPGLDDADDTADLLRALLPALEEDTTVVLDAFALGAVANHPELCAPVADRVAMTPNESEAERLLGREIDDLADDVAEIAARYRAVVSCHGMIADPSGRVWEVTDGGPGLGTSGSGDVLAGALAGLLGRGASPLEATLWASYLHSEAGDRLADRIGPLGFLASELLDELPPLLGRLS
jgi:ADP-dependent NAD(P)H-hydrate dehydratase